MATPEKQSSLSNFMLQQYLTIALKQRTRAYQQAKDTYGNDHAIVRELAKEMSDLTIYIGTLRQ